MMSDIGNDPTGSVYALLNSFYFIAYAPFSMSGNPMCPSTMLTLQWSHLPFLVNEGASGWSSVSQLLYGDLPLPASLQFRITQAHLLADSSLDLEVRVAIPASDSQADILPEAGFVPLVPFYLARMYTKRDLGSRVAYWLCMAPLGSVPNLLTRDAHADILKWLLQRHHRIWCLLYRFPHRLLEDSVLTRRAIDGHVRCLGSGHSSRKCREGAVVDW